ncbi:MAG TPA: hypothetical protein VML55_11580, partial [Planctomycetaceae bacterium]|nr:hypothetical protein [Planctomycetaceae bacterium]
MRAVWRTEALLVWLVFGTSGLGLTAAGLEAQESRSSGSIAPAAHDASDGVDCCAPPPGFSPAWPGGHPLPPPALDGLPPAPAGDPAAPGDAPPAMEPLPEMAGQPLTAFDPGQSLAGLGSSFAAADTPNMIGDLFSIGGA